jgi:sugar lactone lactonase YvrE
MITNVNQKGFEKTLLTNEYHWISCVTISNDNKFIYFNNFWQSCIWKFSCETNRLTLFAGSKDISNCKNGNVKNSHFSRMISIKLSPDNREMYIADIDNFSIRSINMITEQVSTFVTLKTVTCVGSKPGYLIFHPNGKDIIVFDQVHKCLIIVNIQSKQQNILISIMSSIKGLLISPDGRYLYLSGSLTFEFNNYKLLRNESNYKGDYPVLNAENGSMITSYNNELYECKIPKCTPLSVLKTFALQKVVEYSYLSKHVFHSILKCL